MEDRLVSGRRRLQRASLRRRSGARELDRIAKGPLGGVLAGAARGVLGALPLGESATVQIRTFVPGLISAPGALLLSTKPVLLQMGTYPQPGYLDDDIRARDEAGRRFSAPPSPVDLGGGQFRLEFHYWTNDGAVELWHLEGSRSALTGAQGWVSAAPGSFQWPFG